VSSGEADTQAVKRVTITSVAPPNLQPTQTFQATVQVEGWIHTEEDGTFFDISGETARWFSSNPSIFTVNNTSGFVTAQANGQADLIVDVDGYRDRQTITVTTPQNAVASVQIVEGTGAIALTVGQSVTRQARAMDAGGNVLPDKVVAWTELTGTGFITVGADSGDENHQVSIAADAAGTATFKASCEGIDSATLTVNVSATNSEHPNEPAGFTQLLNHDFNTLSNWSNTNNAWCDVAVDTDAAAPVSPSGVVKWTYPAGKGAGPFPQRNFFFANQRELYISATWKISSPWTKHPSGVDKMFFVGTNDNSPSLGNEVVFGFIGTNPSTARMLGSIQGRTSPDGTTTGGYYSANINGTNWSLGSYHTLEVHLVRNTLGQANGRMRWWVDGVEIGNHDQLVFADGVDAIFRSFRWQHYWGGDPASGTKAQDDFVWDDHLYVSGIAA
jgi:hypothetical protein